MQIFSNFINGQEVASTSGETTSIIDPSTGEVYAQAPNSNASDVDKAMVAASSAFKGWRDSTPSERQRALLKIADALESRAEEIVAIESKNTGKPIAVKRSANSL